MSAKGMRGIGYKQGAEFLGALERAGFTFDLVQQVINAPNNLLACQLYKTAYAETNPNSRFELLQIFEFSIPESFRNEVLDQNKKYLLKIFGLKVEAGKRVYPCECIEFLKSQNAILIGESGVQIARHHEGGIKYRLDSHKDYVCFSKENIASADPTKIPVLQMLYGPFWTPETIDWNAGFDNDHALFCFCEMGG